ncbi:MAG: hypothetical protein HQL32_00965 [Planctomycetes bacterium]|nr:hypothetical protein [Planctomycetota bacterium]
MSKKKITRKKRLAGCSNNCASCSANGPEQCARYLAETPFLEEVMVYPKDVYLMTA